LGTLECAELLGLSVTVVNRALQVAREGLADRRPAVTPEPAAGHAALLARYVEAWERADPAALIALLREDAVLAMPPRSAVQPGPAGVGQAIQAMVLVPHGPGSLRLVATEANGMPAFAAYQRDTGDVMRPQSLHVLELRDGAVAAIAVFVDPSLFKP